MKKLTLFFALLLGMFLFQSVETHAAAVPRVMAYDLHLDMSTTGFVKFCYTLNTDAEKVYIIMYAPNGEVAWRRDITSDTRKKKGPQSWTWSQLDLPSFKGMTWAIEAQGAAVSTLACTNDVSETKYQFYRPQGVAVDNNPESDFFGRMYITLPRGGYDHTKGIVVFDPVHKVLSNNGITATGVVLGTNDTYAMHRIAVNPTNNKVYYTKSEDPTAIYELTPDATSVLSDGGTAKNIISGLGFTRADGICFDENGTLFVMDCAKYSSGSQGDIYKVKDNAKTLFCENIGANQPNSIAYDGDGGVWMVQQRGTVGDPYPLAHINKNGEVDFKLTENTNNWFPASNITKGGSVAYDAKNQVVAMGGAGTVLLFQVKMVDGKPTLEKKIGEHVFKTGGTAEVNGLAFDYAGNLIALSKTSERFYHYTVPTDNNTCITPAKKSSTFDGAPVARVFAYDLDVVDDGNSYTFSFTPNATATTGRIVVYNGETKAQVKEFAIDAPITKGVKKEVTISKWSLPKLAGMTWAIELSSNKVESIAVLHNYDDVAKYGFNRPQDVAIDNNPESDFFGRMYIALPKAGGTSYSDAQAGIVVFDPLHKRLASGLKATGVALGSNDRLGMHRIAVNPVNNKVYYAKSESSTAVYELTPNATNILSDGGVAKNAISGISAITNANSLCFDDDGTMYVMDNAASGTGIIYKISNGVAEEWVKTTGSVWGNADNAIVSDGRGGIWVAVQRYSLDNCYSLTHVNSNKVIDFKLTKNSSETIKSLFPDDSNAFSRRGHVAYNSKEDILAFGTNRCVALFKVTYGASDISLELIGRTPTITKTEANIDGLAFDFAGNLVVLSATSERFYHYTVPTNNNICLTPAKSTLTINGPGVSVPRVFAYDLKSELVAPDYEQYILSFKSNVPYTSGNIVFLNEAGVQVGEKVAITSNPMYINRIDLPADVVNWGVELSSNRCTSVDEYTDASKGIYDFYNPQGIAVDNSPESDYFGQIYIAAATDGDATKGKTNRARNQKRGIYVYSPTLQELNPANVGYVPNNVSFTTSDVHEIHRIAVNPLTHEVAFAYNIQDNSAVWNMDPANMTDAATNLINGVSEITRANSLCFDENGVLYVMNRAHTDNGGGTIYKIHDGVATKVIQSSEWAQQHNAMVSDGRGGLWVAQYRGSLDAYSILSHINSSGVMDFNVDNSSTDAIKALFPAENGNVAQRGQLAYHEKEQLLAFVGNFMVKIFKVTYAASGIPSLELYAQTSSLSSPYIDGVAFDYAGNLLVGTGANNGAFTGEQRFYAFSVPTNNNTCLTPAKKAFLLTKNDEAITVDEADSQITTTLAPYCNKPASITLVRGLHLNEWNTLTLPFSMNAAQITEAFGTGAKVAKLTNSRLKSTNSVYIGFSYVNNIEAGTPYLIYPTKQVAEDIATVIINTSTQTISTTILDMIPVLDEEAWEANENNFFLGPDAYLYQDAAGGVMPPLRAYFQFHGLTSQQLSHIRARVAFGEDEATDLEDLEVTTQEEVIKVIENGQLYIIRGGVKYNIQGQIVNK